MLVLNLRELEKMSEIIVTEGETSSNARNTLHNGCSLELTTLTRETSTVEKTKIKSVMLEKRVEGVMKIEDKQRSHTKTLEESSEMVEILTSTERVHGVTTHDGKLKTDEFHNAHEWMSAVRHAGGRNTKIHAMFRTQTENKIKTKKSYFSALLALVN